MAEVSTIMALALIFVAICSCNGSTLMFKYSSLNNDYCYFPFLLTNFYRQDFDIMNMVLFAGCSGELEFLVPIVSFFIFSTLLY